MKRFLDIGDRVVNFIGAVICLAAAIYFGRVALSYFLAIFR